MICKNCGREIPENSIFCNWCGARQLRERRQREEIRVPTPRQLPSGSWNIVLRAEGQSVTEPTREKCLARARAIRAGFIEAEAAKAARGLTLGEAIDAYLETYGEALSPSSVRGYVYIRKGRFAGKMDRPLTELDGWQRAIDTDAKRLAPKTVYNAWGLVCTVMRENGVDPPHVKLPQKRTRELPWLSYAEILTFVDAVKGRRCESAALLALHSLRRSEVYGLTWDDIDLGRDRITVSGATVINRDGELVRKGTTKNVSSARTVKIMIPRLAELLAAQKAAGEPPVLVRWNAMTDGINTVCRSAGLPEVGAHGLRRSFASLGFHLGLSELEVMEIGGWADHNTLRKIYLRLAKEDRLNAENRMSTFYKTGDHID